MNIKYGNEMKGEKKVLVTLNPATLVLNDKIDAKNNHDCQYVFDENEDGSCDHCAEIAYSKSYSRQRGCGRGRHHGRGHH